MLLADLAKASAILVRSALRVDAEAIAAAKQLKVIARAGVGLDNLDVKEATSAGVMAGITEGSGSCLKVQKVVVSFSQQQPKEPHPSA